MKTSSGFVKTHFWNTNKNIIMYGVTISIFIELIALNMIKLMNLTHLDHRTGFEQTKSGNHCHERLFVHM